MKTVREKVFKGHKLIDDFGQSLDSMTCQRCVNCYVVVAPIILEFQSLSLRIRYRSFRNIPFFFFDVGKEELTGRHEVKFPKQV